MTKPVVTRHGAKKALTDAAAAAAKIIERKMRASTSAGRVSSSPVTLLTISFTN